MHSYCMWQNHRNNYVLMSQMMEAHCSTLKIKLVTRAELQQLSHLMVGLEALAVLPTWHFQNLIRWSSPSSIPLHVVAASKAIRGKVDICWMAWVLKIRHRRASLQPLTNAWSLLCKTVVIWYPSAAAFLKTWINLMFHHRFRISQLSLRTLLFN